MAKPSKKDTQKQIKSYKKEREDLLDNVIDDFYNNKKRLVKVNFVRGLSFGVGSAIGGTIILALVLWILSQMVDIPVIGQFIKEIIKYTK